MKFEEWIKLDDMAMIEIGLPETITILKSRMKGFIVVDQSQQAVINNFLLFITSASSIKRNIGLITDTVAIGQEIIDIMPENSPSQTYALGILAVACTVGNVLVASEKQKEQNVG